MKKTIKVFTLASDDDCGTKADVFATEEEAVSALLDKVESDDYTKEQLTRFYFFPAELPEEFEDFYELLSSLKSDYDTNNIDEHTLDVEIAVPFISQVARMTYDGEEIDGEEFVMENDDAVDTLNGLIHEARELENEVQPSNPIKLFIEGALDAPKGWEEV
jgi:hypothetical protein